MTRSELYHYVSIQHTIKAFLGLGVGFGVLFEDSHCLERLVLSRRIHSSSSMTALDRNGSARNLSNEVQTVHRRSLLASDNWRRTHIPCLCILPISRSCLCTVGHVNLRLLDNSCILNLGSDSRF